MSKIVVYVWTIAPSKRWTVKLPVRNCADPILIRPMTEALMSLTAINAEQFVLENLEYKERQYNTV